MKWMPRAFLSVWSVLPAALAAEDDVVVDEKVVIDENNVDENNVFDNWRANGIRMSFNAETFERWIFGGGGDAQRDRLRNNADLEMAINKLDRQHHLTDIQKEKLMLAGRGIRKRFFDRVEVARQTFVAADDGQVLTDEDRREIQWLQSLASASLFGPESLFSKTARTTLNEEQRAAIAAANHKRQSLHHRGMVAATVLTVERTVELRRPQRDALTKLLLEETPIPTVRYDTDNKLMMYQFAGLAEAGVKPLLDDDQWQNLQSQLTEFRAYEALLRREGLITPDNMKDDVSQADDAPAGAAQAAQFRKKTE